jgi:Peptidase C13 family
MGGSVRLIVALLAAALSLPAETYYLTVSGLGGEPDYEQRFGMWAKDIDKILKSSPDAKVETLVDGTREQVRGALDRIAKEAQPEDAVVVMLIGHGSFDGYDYKINLPGPDLTASDLAASLDRIPASRQLVVNMTSSSGGSIEFLRRPHRVLITATKTGTEKNATVFARYWVEALRDPAADANKNEVISALEAFKYADKKTAEFYESQKRLATEHAVLEDTGKGEAVRTPGPENGEGLLAAAFPLVRLGATASAAQDPAKRQLLAKKEELEEQIDKLKYEKAALAPDDYKKQLEGLLLELARTQAELDK